MGVLKTIRDDWRVNHGYPKSQFALTLFRLAQAAREPRDEPVQLRAIPLGILYRIIVDWMLGIELPWRTRVGNRLRIFHGTGLVVNDETIIGDDVELRQGVTLGNDGKTTDCPVINQRASVGANACVLGGITVGSGARIGANAVVLRDVPTNAVAVGVPARILIR